MLGARDLLGATLLEARAPRSRARVCILVALIRLLLHSRTRPRSLTLHARRKLLLDPREALALCDARCLEFLRRALLSASRFVPLSCHRIVRTSKLGQLGFCRVLCRSRSCLRELVHRCAPGFSRVPEVAQFIQEGVLATRPEPSDAYRALCRGLELVKQNLGFLQGSVRRLLTRGGCGASARDGRLGRCGASARDGRSGGVRGLGPHQ